VNFTVRRMITLAVGLLVVASACSGADTDVETSSPASTATAPTTTTASVTTTQATTTTATATTAAPTTTVDVQRDPAVWVTNGADKKVLKIDPASGEILLEIDVDAPPGGIALGAGSAWIASFAVDYLLRLDSETGAELARITIGSDGSGVTFSDGVAWVAQFAPGTVTAIDPATNEILKVIDVGAGASGMAPGSVWVTSFTDMKLSNVDVDFSNDTATVDAVVLQGQGSAPAAGGGFVGATVFDLGQFQVFDADLFPVATFELGSNANVATYGFGAFWVTNSTSGDVYRIDPSADEPELVTTIPLAVGIAVGDDMVYVASFSNGVVYQFPPDDPGAMTELADTGSEAFEVAYGTAG